MIWLCSCPACNGEGPPDEPDDLDAFITEQCHADPKFAAAYAARQAEARRELAETFANIDATRKRVIKRLAGYYDQPVEFDTSTEPPDECRTVRFVAAPPEDPAYDW